MMSIIKSLLMGLIEDLDNGRYELSKNDLESVIQSLKLLTDRSLPMSKYSAYRYLGIGRSSFDQLVRDGKIPRGKHRIGFKELEWNKKDLDEYIAKYKLNK